LTRVITADGLDELGNPVLEPTTQRPDGTTIYVPELTISFSTAMGFIPGDPPKIPWALSLDRKKKNLWTPIGGGEDDYPISGAFKEGSIFDFGVNTCRIESWQESGVKIQPLGTGPIWIAAIPYGYPGFEAKVIKKPDWQDDKEIKIDVIGAHTLLYYYAVHVLGEPQLCPQDGAESAFRNVELLTLTVEETFAAFASGKINAYPTMKEAFLRLAWQLNNPNVNTNLKPYPVNWAEDKGLMERTWKNDFINLMPKNPP